MTLSLVGAQMRTRRDASAIMGEGSEEWIEQAKTDAFKHLGYV